MLRKTERKGYVTEVQFDAERGQFVEVKARHTFLDRAGTEQRLLNSASPGVTKRKEPDRPKLNNEAQAGDTTYPKVYASTN
jgi:hypothetical protein